jgi:subtilase family protein
MTFRTRWLPAFAVALLALGSGSAEAGPKSGIGPRVNQMLMALHAEYAAHEAQTSLVRFASTNRLLRVLDGRVAIDAVADGDVAALQATLAALGMRHMSAFGRVVSGEFPIAAIPALGGVKNLRFVQPSVLARHAGAVTSEGDRAMRADIARATSGVTGVGVKVGVLSDSFDCKGGAAADIAAGELPASVEVVQEAPSCAEDTDEGRAMLQIVHDVAPGASLAFATADGGLANLANNILALRARGAKVIVDDIVYLDEPMFQDGIVAQAADTVVRQGAAYFSAAGNYARQSYESPFRAGASFVQDQFPSAPGAPTFFGGVAHNFAPSGTPDHFQRITIPAGRTLLISFQWDSPFFSAGGLGTPNDVDIYLFDAARAKVVAGSATDNVNGDGDALEIFSFTNNGATADFNLMIVSFAGPPPGYIKYVQLGSSSIIVNEFDTASSTLFGHTNSTFAAAVGAARFSSTPAFGVNPPVLERFSSGGGTPIVFDTAGNRLVSQVVRQKPDVVAPDGVSTAVNGFSPFLGTSAAAPHAAAVAALMLEKQPVLAPVTVYSALERTAIDMGPPAFDFDSGFGLIQADAAVALVTTLQAQSAAVLPSSRSVTVGSPATAFATVINAGPGTAVGVGISVASPLLGNFSFQTTDPQTNALTGTPNTPVDIPAGSLQTFIVSITPSTAFAANDVQFNFAGANTYPTPPLSGVSTLLLSASLTPVPDVIALAATVTPGLTAVIPGNNGATAFAVAAANVGVSGSIQVTTNSGSLPIVVGLCQTTGTGACVEPVSTSVTTTIGAGATPTFSFFVLGQGFVPFDPAANRIVVRFIDTATGTTVGSTSVAVRTQ